MEITIGQDMASIGSEDANCSTVVFDLVPQQGIDLSIKYEYVYS